MPHRQLMWSRGRAPDVYGYRSGRKTSATDSPLAEDSKGRKSMRKLSAILACAAAAIVLSSSAQAQVIMRASHQFPGGKGDVRDDMVQMIAKDAKDANIGLDIQVY